MNKNCKINLPESKVTKALKERVLNDVDLCSYWSECMLPSGEFSLKFKEWYKDKGYKTELSLDSAKPVNIVNAIIAYYKTIHPSVSDSANPRMKNQNVIKFGYSDDAARSLGIRLVGTRLINIFIDNKNKHITIAGDKKAYYITQVRNAWNNLIFELAKKNKSVAELKQEYETADDKAAFMKNILGGKNMSIEHKNAYAVWQELNASDDTVNEYFKSVIADKRLYDVHREIGKEFSDKEDIIEEASKDEEQVEKDEAGTQEQVEDYEPDFTVSQYNSHTGEYKHFNMHVSQRVRNYFNTLPVLSSSVSANGVYLKDTNNVFGIADTMNASQCISMLYNNGRFKNADDMIDSIRNIARNVPGFKSFAKFANDLEADANFKAEVFKIFAKTKMTRMECVKENGTSKIRISNIRVNPHDAFLYDCTDDFKSNLMNIDRGFITSTIERLRGDFNFYNKNKNEDTPIALGKSVNQLIELIKSYFPSISEESIKAYIDINGDYSKDSIERKTENALHLLTLLNSINNSAPTAIATMLAIQKSLSEVKEKNLEVAKLIAEGKATVNDYYSAEEIASTQILEKEQFDKIETLVSALLPYSVVDTDLNSRTISGNLSSAILNNSLLTHLKRLVEDVVIVDGKETYPSFERYGNELLMSKQSKYSSLFFPQYDKNGVRLNPNSLFNIVNGKAVVNGNPNSKFTIFHFIGSANRDTGKNAAYHQMNDGSFMPTSFISFFSGAPDNDYSKTDRNELGTYFLRTPSDAKNTFAICAPKHKTSGLFKIANEEEITNRINKMFMSNFIDTNKLLEVTGFESADEIDSKSTDIKAGDAIKLLTTKESIWIKSDKGVIKDENGKVKAIVLTMDKPEADDHLHDELKAYQTSFILTGKVRKVNNAYIVENYNLEGIYQNGSTTNFNLIGLGGTQSFYTRVTDFYRNKLEVGSYELNGTTYDGIKYEVDTEHETFKVVFNRFKQELLDAAIALDYWLENDNGYVKRVNGEVVFKEGRNKDSMYDFYDWDGKNFIVKTPNGEKLTGKVFASRSFTLTLNKNGKNVNKNYLESMFSSSDGANDDGAINLLYGGQDSTFLRTVKETIEEDGEPAREVVTDIKLTEAQENRARALVAEFLSDYVSDCRTKLTEKSQFITIPLTSENVADYAVNNFLMFCEYDSLFEGDTAFYKDGQTLLKRAKEGQASGIPMGIADYNALDTDVSEPLHNTVLDRGFVISVDKSGVETKTPIREILKGTSLEHLQIGTTFKAVTIENTKMTNTTVLTALVKQLHKQCGLDINFAKDILFGPMSKDKNGKWERHGGFTDTKVNDAQSYITWEEFVRRLVAKGDFMDYLPLIRKIEDPNSNLTKEDIAQFIQVQKNVYYDLHYNRERGIFTPRFIKNAEFVLVPRLIKGTQLEAVYNAMKAAGIDQLNTKETSKASNNNVLRLWDNEENLTEETINTFIEQAKVVKEDFSYNNLYTQQETPQHVNAKNKASIQIMKKILDNIGKGHKLYKYKERLTRNFIAHIEASFKRVMDELEIKIDKYGNIVSLNSINEDFLYERLSEEMQRLGVDSNMLEYVAMDEGEVIMPAFINSVVSKLESTVQSLFNSRITRQTLKGFHAAQVTNVGWAPMATAPTEYVIKDKTNVTDTLKERLSKEEYDVLSNEDKVKYINSQVSYSKKLKYHPNGEQYIEVMLPLSAFGLTRNQARFKNMTREAIDAQLIKELEDEGLDKVIGYRIPTEAKCSMAIMKVVGFVDDIYGSTIVVPNDWVSQTGSDFDIDSIYGIQFETYKDLNGVLHKVKYIGEDEDGNAKDLTFDDYLNYIRYNLNTRNTDKSSDKVKEARKSIFTKLDAIYDAIEEIQGISFSALPKPLQNKIKEVHSILSKTHEGWNKKDAHIDNLKQSCASVLAALIELRRRFNTGKLNAKITEDVITSWENAVNEYIKDTELLVNFYEGRIDTTGIDMTQDKYSALQDAMDEFLDNSEEVLKEFNLLTYEDFVTSSPEQINTAEARNNAICDSMLKILSDPETLEENLMRSNFDDIIAARDAIMSPNDKVERENRSPYNVMDQIAYQDDAMSGFTLKGMSVVGDTMCSLCNTIMPVIDDEHKLVVNYNFEDLLPIKTVGEIGKETVEEYSEEELKKLKAKKFKELKARFGEKNVEITNTGFRVTHTRYGWSPDNRNVVGKLITAYSAETTAHILDAIKEGFIPGVNLYTFNVYKHFVNIGSDFRTAIAFMMQPGVKEINKAYSETNSVFTDVTSGNPIDTAIRRITQSLGIAVNDYTPIDKCCLALASNKKLATLFAKMFNINEHDAFKIHLYSGKQSLPIDVNLMVDRIKDKGIFTDKKNGETNKLLFDLAVCIQFNNLKEAADRIGNLSRVCNPDKFGAKQTVFATQKIFDNIIDSELDTSSNTPVEKDCILNVNGEHFLKAVYPSIKTSYEDAINNNDIDASAYPTMAAFLKYATATSIAVARRVLPTERKGFRVVVSTIEKAFSGLHPIVSEEEDKTIQKYVLSYLYDQCPGIVLPISVDNRGHIINVSTSSSSEFEALKQVEKERIFGFSRPQGFKVLKVGSDTEYEDFSVVNINKPTVDEQRQFMQLSPAQKVQWIKANFSEHGVFRFIHCNTTAYHNRGKTAMHTMRYVADNSEPNTIYAMFKQAFYNNNPLVKLAAYDLIKYGVVVENLRMTSTAVNKVIDNSPLREAFGDDGTGLIPFLKNIFYRIDDENTVFSPEEINTIHERYLRSHLDTTSVKSLKLTKASMEKYGIKARPRHMLASFPLALEGKTTEESLADWQDKMVKAGIFEYNRKTKAYVPNQYIKLLNKKGKVTLYKIESSSYNNGVLLYPLNELMASEVGDISANDAFNKYMPSKAYKAFVYKWNQEGKTNAGISSEAINDVFNGDDIDTTIRRVSKPPFRENAPLNLMELAQTKHSVENLVNQIGQQLEDNPTKDITVASLDLGDYVKSTNLANGVEDTITYNDKVFNITIAKKNMQLYKKRYILQNNPTSEITDPVIRTIVEDAIRDIEISGKDPRFYKLDTLFVVRPSVPAEFSKENEEDDDIYSAALYEVNSDSYAHIKGSAAATSDKTAQSFIRAMTNKTITSENHDIIKVNNDFVTQHVAQYAKLKSDAIKKEFETFWPKNAEKTEFYKITDPEVQILMRTNPKVLDKYISAVNEADAFIKNFDVYNTFDIKTEGEEDEAGNELVRLKTFIEDITKAANTVKRLPIDEANQNLLEGYMTYISGNPNIQMKLLNICEGFHKTYGSMWQFHDIMENGTPLLQTILKDVMGNISAQEKAAKRLLEKHRRVKQRIYDEAKRHGMTIREDHVFNGKGMLIMDFNDEFITDANNLREARDNAAATHGLGSYEHLVAKYNYDLFKYKYIQQPVDKAYYKTRLSLEQGMLEGSHKDNYIKYMKLFYEQLDILEYLSAKGLRSEDNKRLSEIASEMMRLRQKDAEITGIDETDFTLEEYADIIGDLNSKYFGYNTAYGFDAQLDMYLAIIEDAEMPGPDGTPTVSQADLANNRRYQEAKQWLKNNAKLQITELDESGGKHPFFRLYKKACQILKRNGVNARHVAVSNAAKTITDAYDERGVIDGTKFSKEARASIKAAQQATYSVDGLNGMSDRALISYSTPADIPLFTSEFYKNMTPNGIKTQEYREIVARINEILGKYVDADGRLALHKMPVDDKHIYQTIADLKALYALYGLLRETPKREGSTNNAEVKSFISNNVKFEANRPAFDLVKSIRDLSTNTEFKTALNGILYEVNENGQFVDENGDEVLPGEDGVIDGTKLVPNRYLFSYAVPKAEPGTDEYNSWVDLDKTNAQGFFKKYFTKTLTKYYYQEQAEAARRGAEAYKEWWLDNHVYNTFTDTWEALDIWYESKPNGKVLEDFGEDAYGWSPKASQRERVPVEEYANPDYVEGGSIYTNYIKGSGNGKYDTKVEMNEYERQLRDHLYDLLNGLASTNQAQSYFKKGYLPARAKAPETNAKIILKEFSKLLGFNISTNNGTKVFYDDDDIDYSKDVTPHMPMTDMLRSKDYKKYDVKEPKLKDFANPQEFREKHAEWEKGKKEYDAQLRKEHEDLLDKNWLSVVEDFILKAGTYNAIKENKNKLYYLLNFLEKQRVYMREFGALGDLKKDKRKGSDDDVVYATTRDDDLIKQYKNFIRRLCFDQWKEAESSLTKLANQAQGFTSANYMMLNIKSGISNITLGEIGIWQEGHAGEYFKKLDWGFGTYQWGIGSIGFMRGMGKEQAYGLQDAIVKYFNVVDYDEVLGIPREMSFAEKSKIFRDMMFSPQTVGEHFMQNSVLFACLKSHRILKNPINGEWSFMNEKEYIRYREINALFDIIPESKREEFNEYFEDIKKDANKKKDFAWFRKDIVNDFVKTHCNKEERDKFYKLRDERRASYIEEFEKNKDIFSQLSFENGRLKFAKDSILETLHNDETDSDISVSTTTAEKLMAQFGERVKHINNHIHGTYNKLGAAYIEKKWYGSLIMQYHKHLPFGILKRWKARGFFSEFRGSVEKGMYVSLWDYLNIEWRTLKNDLGLTEENVNALESLKQFTIHSLDFMYRVVSDYRKGQLSDYDKANIRRMFKGFQGVAAAVLTTVAILALGGGDDDDSLAYNLALYEADRLASEAWLYTPMGLLNETKKLMSTPISAYSVVNDFSKTLSEMWSLIFSGEADGYYHAGRFNGEHKALVFLKRRIPAWAGIQGLINIADNNHYFKVGKNPIGILPTDDMAEWTRNMIN